MKCNNLFLNTNLGGVHYSHLTGEEIEAHTDEMMCKVKELVGSAAKL